MTLTGGARSDGPATRPAPAPAGTAASGTSAGKNAPPATRPFWRSFTGYGRKRNASSATARFWRSFTGYERKRNASCGNGARNAAHWALFVFGVAGLAGVTLSAHIARGGPLLVVRWRLLGELVAWAVVWIVAVAAAFQLPRRAALPLMFGVAVVLRVAAIAGPPTTSDDFYRYSWDGRVQAAGVNPYQYTPASGHFAHLREPWLWPEERPCPLAYRPDACTRINRPSAHTIYPPVAETWFAGIYRLTGIEGRWKPWQVAGLLTDVAVVTLLAVALRRSGKDPRWCVLYALCPAPVLEMVNNAHVDGLAILLTIAAFVVASGPVAVSREEAERRSEAAGATSCAPRTLTAVDAMGAQLVAVPRSRHLVAGGLVGLAALVKLYPALLVLALVAAGPARRSRRLIRIGCAAGVVVIMGYLPHVLRVGTKAIGFLPGYLREEHYDGAGRYLVAGALRVPGGIAGGVSALALVGAAAWVWRRRPPAPQAAAVLMGALLLAASPVQPWYAVTLLAFATLAVEPQWAAVVIAGYPYFFAVILFHPQRTGIGQLAYGLAAAAVAGAALLRGWRARARSMEGCPPNGC